MVSAANMQLSAAVACRPKLQILWDAASQNAEQERAAAGLFFVLKVLRQA